MKKENPQYRKNTHSCFPLKSTMRKIPRKWHSTDGKRKYRITKNHISFCRQNQSRFLTRTKDKIVKEDI